MSEKIDKGPFQAKANVLNSAERDPAGGEWPRTTIVVHVNDPRRTSLQDDAAAQVFADHLALVLNSHDALVAALMRLAPWIERCATTNAPDSAVCGAHNDNGELIGMTVADAKAIAATIAALRAAGVTE